MSTIKVNEILDATGSTTTPPTIPALDRRFCTAWVNFNGTGTVAIRDSYNVSSITDNGTGDYTVNFTVALANADYSLSGAGGTATATFSAVMPFAAAMLTTGVQISVQTATPAVVDREVVSLQIFGGQ